MSFLFPSVKKKGRVYVGPETPSCSWPQRVENSNYGWQRFFFFLFFFSFSLRPLSSSVQDVKICVCVVCVMMPPPLPHPTIGVIYNVIYIKHEMIMIRHRGLPLYCTINGVEWKGKGD